MGCTRDEARSRGLAFIPASKQETQCASKNISGVALVVWADVMNRTRPLRSCNQTRSKTDPCGLHPTLVMVWKLALALHVELSLSLLDFDVHGIRGSGDAL